MNDNTRVELLLMILDLASNLGIDDLIAVIDKIPLPEPTQGSTEALARIANELRGLTTEQAGLNARWDAAYRRWLKCAIRRHANDAEGLKESDISLNIGCRRTEVLNYTKPFVSFPRQAHPPEKLVEAFEHYVASLESGQ